MSEADTIFQDRFAKPRTPRSEAYKAGCLAALRYRLEGRPMNRPYAVGTAQADAWFAGGDEGHMLWRGYSKVV